MRFLDEVFIDSGSITGSLLGTSSYAISSSYALTASYVLNLDIDTLLPTGSENYTLRYNSLGNLESNNILTIGDGSTIGEGITVNGEDSRFQGSVRIARSLEIGGGVGGGPDIGGGGYLTLWGGNDYENSEGLRITIMSGSSNSYDLDIDTSNGELLSGTTLIRENDGYFRFKRIQDNLFPIDTQIEMENNGFGIHLENVNSDNITASYFTALGLKARTNNDSIEQTGIQIYNLSNEYVYNPIIIKNGKALNTTPHITSELNKLSLLHTKLHLGGEYPIGSYASIDGGISFDLLTNNTRFYGSGSSNRYLDFSYDHSSTQNLNLVIKNNKSTFSSGDVLVHDGTNRFIIDNINNYVQTSNIFENGIIVTGSIKTPDYIDFKVLDTSSVPSQLEGRVFYDTDEQALTVFNGITDTSLQVGQEIVLLVRNNSGVTIDNGDLVMITGTIGNSGRLTVAKAVLDGSVSPYKIIGVATNSILNGADGLVTSYGKVKGINTTGTPASEDWDDGDVIYANSLSPSGLSKFIPASPNLKIEIGVVIHSATNGVLFVNLDRKHRLSDLYNVTNTSLSSGDLLVLNGSNVWTNSKILSGNYQLTGSLLVSGSLTGSFNGTFTGNGSGLTGIVATIEATTTDVSTFTNQTEIIITHNLNTVTPLIQVFDTEDEIFIPKTIKVLNNNQIRITFSELTSGKVVIAKGGHIVSGSIPTSSYSFTSSFSNNSLNSISSSYSLSSSYSITASYSNTSSYSETSSYSVFSQNSSTSSYSINSNSSISSSYSLSSSFSQNSATASYALNAGATPTGMLQVLGFTFNTATTKILSNTVFPNGAIVHRVTILKPTAFNGNPTINMFVSGSTPLQIVSSSNVNLTDTVDDTFLKTYVVSNANSGSVSLEFTAGGATQGVGRALVYYTTELNS